MPRPTYPRSGDSHAAMAGRILARHAAATGSPVTIPVPIEMIVERTYGLDILWEEIPEDDGSIILGALAPRARRIVLNSRHQAMFERWMGPERFTLAHELAHWIYDADSPDQLALDMGGTPQERYCYHRGSSGLSELLKVREANANRLAASLLLPEDLVRSAVAEAVMPDISSAAAKWQVSRKMLEMRLRELGLAGDSPPSQSALRWP